MDMLYIKVSVVVAMDNKLGIIYCTISEYKYLYIFNFNSLKILSIVMKPMAH